MNASQAILQILVPILLLVGIIGAIAVRCVAAVFSPRVRNSIARHRLAHILWLVAGVSAILLLVAWLYPHFGNRPPRGANPRPGVDARQRVLFVFEDPRPGSTHREFGASEELESLRQV